MLTLFQVLPVVYLSKKRFNMKTFILYTSILLSYLATSCISVSHQNFYAAPEFNPKGSVKVIAVNTGDVLYGRLEHTLGMNGANVISDNRLNGPIPTGFTTVTTPDTTYQSPNYQMLSLQLFDNKASDYIIKYQYDSAMSLFKLAPANLNIAVINTQSGKTEASYAFTQSRLGWGKRSADKVLDHFARKLMGVR